MQNTHGLCKVMSQLMTHYSIIASVLFRMRINISLLLVGISICYNAMYISLPLGLSFHVLIAKKEI